MGPVMLQAPNSMIEEARADGTTMRVVLSFQGCHRRGGVERVMLECANFLRSRGHLVTVLASEFDHAALDPQIEKLKVAPRFHNPLLRLVSFGAGSSRFLARLNPPPDVHAAFGVICPPGGVLWVPSVHRAWIETSQRERALGGQLKQWANPMHYYLLARERWYFKGRRYQRLIALSERVSADLTRFYGVPSADIEILPNGYNPAEFNVRRRISERDDARRDLGYAGSERVIVFVANELARKGFGPLIRAIAQLKSPKPKLLVVGRVTPGSYTREIGRLGLADGVKFIGPSSDVGHWYAAADLFALPTTYEAWGLVIVEALASGLPVLTSRLAGAAIAVREGQTGLLLDDPKDVREISAKLARLLERPPTDSAMVESTVSDYRWDQILPRYEQILMSASMRRNFRVVQRQEARL